MQPVVDGLQQAYQDRVEFRSLNAAFGEGKATFQAYVLPGHPSYVVLNPEGEIIWKGFGLQTAESLTDVLDAELDRDG